MKELPCIEGRVPEVPLNHSTWDPTLSSYRVWVRETPAYFMYRKSYNVSQRHKLGRAKICFWAKPIVIVIVVITIIITIITIIIYSQTSRWYFELCRLHASEVGLLTYDRVPGIFLGLSAFSHVGEENVFNLLADLQANHSFGGAAFPNDQGDDFVQVHDDPHLPTLVPNFFRKSHQSSSRLRVQNQIP